ncbi:MAG: SDR family oxidoreductase [Gammaproteobacteria bacterium]|nr:SDR family oxidoreductase [Gammaproteobacteria bacterium]
MTQQDKPLAGKTALVIGGSRGIGAGIAQRLATAGANVSITYAARSDAADAVVRACEALDVKAMAQQADAGDVASGRAVVDATVKTLGGLDIFVYSAVANEMGDITAITEEGFDRVIAVNLKGLMFTAQAAVSHMQQGGRLILISSVFSEMVPFPGLDLYTMSKSAMIGLTRAWARDLAEKGITVNCIQPGPVETDMNPLNGPLAQVLLPMTAIKRYGSVAEIAEMAAYLAHPLAGNVTGGIFDNDGGLSL